MTVRLRKSFIKLLEEDKEFRYTVAGYLGLKEVLMRLDGLEQRMTELHQEQIRLLENQNRLWENQNKLWEEVRSLREGQNKLWEAQNKLWESQNKLWEEVKTLREGQNKLWEEVQSLREGQNKLWEEVRSLREGQNKLWEEVRSLREGQNKLWEEVRSLREGQEKLWESQNKLWEEVRSLREGQNKLWEGQNKLWEEVRELRKSHDELWKSHLRLERYVKTGFEGLRKALHITFEDYSRSFAQLLLDEIGYGWCEVERKILVDEGRLVEVDIFCEKPLVVGEVTAVIESLDDGLRELDDLLKKADLCRRVYGSEPVVKLLCVGRVREGVGDVFRRRAEEVGVRLVLGYEVREAVL